MACLAGFAYERDSIRGIHPITPTPYSYRRDLNHLHRILLGQGHVTERFIQNVIETGHAKDVNKDTVSEKELDELLLGLDFTRNAVQRVKERVHERNRWAKEIAGFRHCSGEAREKDAGFVNVLRKQIEGYFRKKASVAESAVEEWKRMEESRVNVHMLQNISHGFHIF
jgi:hypothetical protein